MDDAYLKLGYCDESIMNNEMKLSFYLKREGSTERTEVNPDAVLFSKYTFVLRERKL